MKLTPDDSGADADELSEGVGPDVLDGREWFVTLKTWSFDMLFGVFAWQLTILSQLLSRNAEST